MMHYSSVFIPGKLAFALKTWEQKFFEPLIKELLRTFNTIICHISKLPVSSSDFSDFFFLQYYDKIIL